MAQKLKITKAAVTAVTNDMLQTGVLLEKGEKAMSDETRTRGRRKILLDINENFKLVFGVTIDRDSLFVGLTNLKGQPLDKKIQSIQGKSYREILEQIVAVLTSVMKDNCITNENLLALGLCISEGCGAIIEGTRLSDKLTRLKKDLSHALPMKIATASLTTGALAAQRLFGGENTPNMIMLRLSQSDGILYGESGISISGKAYQGHTENAGGFNALLKSSATRCEVLVEQVADAVIICNLVIDTEKIFCFGSFFEEEKNLSYIMEAITKKGCKKPPLHLALIKNETLYLAPCAFATDCFFYVNV